MAQMSQAGDLTSGPMLKKIILFSLPLAASSFLQLLFNAADVVVVGRFAGSAALAAVGSNGALINLLVNLFVGLALGANVVAARCYGAKDDQGVHETVQTAVTLSLVGGVLMAFVGFFAAHGLLELMSSPEDVIDLATLYLKIYFIGMPMTMLYNFNASLLRAVGDTRRPLVCLAVAGVINVVLNLLFVIVFQMSVAGVALATILSQTVSAIMVTVLLVREQGAMHLDLRHLGFHKKAMLRPACRSAEHRVQPVQRGDPVGHQFLWLHDRGRKLCRIQPRGLHLHRHECLCAGGRDLYQPERGCPPVRQPRPRHAQLPALRHCGGPVPGLRRLLWR